MSALDFAGSTKLGTGFRHLKRYKDLISVFIKFGFVELLEHLDKDHRLALGLLEGRDYEDHALRDMDGPVRFRLMLQEMGTTWIKFGQILSTRPDLLPQEYIDELGQLQSHVQFLELEEVRSIIHAELGKDPEEVFAHFSKEPLAAASIAQVHRARLKDGTEVVIKVRRPDIDKPIRADLEIAAHFAAILEERSDSWRVHHPVDLIAQFKEILEAELDFRVEAAHVEKLAYHFKERPEVLVPRIHREISTEKVLVMDFIDGIPVSQLEQLKDTGVDTAAIGKLNAELLFEQIFKFGYFHADPHPGNILVRPGPRVCYLDFGMMGRMDRDTRLGMADLLHAVIRRDECRAVDALLSLTTWSKMPDRKKLESDVSEFIERHFYQPILYLSLGEVLRQLLDRTIKHRLTLPQSIFIMIKSLSTVEGWVKKLNPELDVIYLAKPFVRDARMERLDPQKWREDLIEMGLGMADLVRSIPREAPLLMDKIKQGEVKLIMEHKGLDDFKHLIDETSRRLSAALIVAAIIVGSSLIIHAKVPPMYHDVSVLGLLGYLVALVEGVVIIVARLKTISKKDRK